MTVTSKSGRTPWSIITLTWRNTNDLILCGIIIFKAEVNAPPGTHQHSLRPIRVFIERVGHPQVPEMLRPFKYPFLVCRAFGNRRIKRAPNGMIGEKQLQRLGRYGSLIKLVSNCARGPGSKITPKTAKTEIGERIQGPSPGQPARAKSTATKSGIAPGARAVDSRAMTPLAGGAANGSISAGVGRSTSLGGRAS